MLIAATTMFLVGGIAMYGLLTPAASNTYDVSVVPREGAGWTLWIPWPVIEMALSVDGEATVVGPVETSHGRLGNVTGAGNAGLHLRDERTFYGLERPRNTSVRLTGWDEDGFWIWRAGTAENETVHVELQLFWSLSRFGLNEGCAGYNVRADLMPGWNRISSFLIGDCFLNPMPVLILSTIAIGTIVCGTAMTATALLKREASGRGR